MSSKPKFSKLRLGGISRKVSESQISKFFTTDSSTDSKDTNCSESSSKNPETVENLKSEQYVNSTIKDHTETVSQKNESTSKNCVNDKNSRKRKIPSRAVNIKKFVDDDDNDFKTPKKNIKKITSNTTKRTKTKQNKTKNKQMKIKSAFLQNEEKFTQFIAQQSIAENVDADELQIALALSRSQVIEVDDNSNQSDDIGHQFQKFQFKSNEKNEDYDLSLYLFGKTNKKWANKFTPLTMRNVEKQTEKINRKIEEFLSNQFVNKNNKIENNLENINLTSNFLLSVKSDEHIFKKHANKCDNFNIIDYYIEEMFEPTSTKIDHLLRDYRNIPGRDFSPPRILSRITSNNHIELEISEDCSSNNNVESKLEEHNCDIKNLLYSSQEINSIPKETRIFEREISPDIFEQTILDNKDKSEIINEHHINTFDILEDKKNSPEIKNDDQKNVSGNIFADKINSPITVNEDHIEYEINMNVSITKSPLIDKRNLSNNSQDHEEVIFFENFSSDEVKAINIKSKSNNDDLIDLTQEIENEFDNENEFLTPSKRFIDNNKNPSIPSTSRNCSKENISPESTNSFNDNLILLSDDDEINYSFQMANKLSTCKIKKTELSIDLTETDSSSYEDGNNEDSPMKNIEYSNDDNKNNPNVSFIDLLNSNKSDDETENNTEYLFNNEFAPTVEIEKSNSFNYDNTIDDDSFNLEKLKLKYGIIDKKSNKNSTIHRKTHSESFLVTNENDKMKSFKRFSSNKKFHEFIENDDEDFSDFDEFDKLVYVGDKSKLKKPQNIENLINSDIIENTEVSYEEVIKNGKTYLIKTKNVAEKPDYERMDSTNLFKELYKYGLKPLKRKQAVIMLNYIYNQTHPLIVAATGTTKDIVESIELQTEKQKGKSKFMFNFNDCYGKDLLIEDGLNPEIENEDYIFPTNTRVKISTAALPFHVAWFNLVKSSEKLRESLLHYEPFDMQEVYSFLKNIGYRYEPKEMKKFFDNRCIIFRYDLSDGTSNRHIRKNSQKNIKT